MHAMVTARLLRVQLGPDLQMRNSLHLGSLRGSDPELSWRQGLVPKLAFPVSPAGHATACMPWTAQQHRLCLHGIHKETSAHPHVYS